MYMIFDIGSTRTRVGFSKDLKKLESHQIFFTPKKYSELLSLLQACYDNYSEHTILAAAGCVPGAIDDEGVIVRSGNLTEYSGRRIANDIASVIGINPLIGNDASFAVLGESVFGLDSKYKHVAYLTVSTGIGGAVAYDEQILPAMTSFEPGKMLLRAQDCTTTFEDVVSGRFIRSKYGVDASELKDRESWVQMQKNLEQLIINLVWTWSPSALVVGGGLIEFGGFEFDDIVSRVQSYVGKANCPLISKSTLGAIGGLYGGMVVLRNNKQKNHR